MLRSDSDLSAARGERCDKWIRSPSQAQPPSDIRKMAMSKFTTCALIAGLALFVAALLSPAIVFKPDARSNPKRSGCAFAVKDNVMCESFSFGGPGMTTCGVVDGKTPRQDVCR